MPIPVSDSTKETIIQHFKRKRINFDEDSLISVLQNSNKKYDIYWAVIGLRDVGTEKCIPYLKLLKDFPMQDVKDCLLLTISHIVGSTETEFYVSVLQEKGSKKDYPLWAIKESADERAKLPVLTFVENAYKKIRQPSSSYYSCAYVDGLIFLSKYYDLDVRIQNLFQQFVNIQNRLPQGIRESLKKEISFFNKNINE